MALKTTKKSLENVYYIVLGNILGLLAISFGYDISVGILLPYQKDN